MRASLHSYRISMHGTVHVKHKNRKKERQLELLSTWMGSLVEQGQQTHLRLDDAGPRPTIHLPTLITPKPITPSRQQNKPNQTAAQSPNPRDFAVTTTHARHRSSRPTTRKQQPPTHHTLANPENANMRPSAAPGDVLMGLLTTAAWALPFIWLWPPAKSTTRKACQHPWRSSASSSVAA